MGVTIASAPNPSPQPLTQVDSNCIQRVTATIFFLALYSFPIFPQNVCVLFMLRMNLQDILCPLSSLNVNYLLPGPL